VKSKGVNGVVIGGVSFHLLDSFSKIGSLMAMDEF
jgi:hypothetical protein